MLGFYLKKAFFDLWDNLLAIVLINLGFLVAMAGVIYLPFLLSFSPVLSLVGLSVGLVIFNIYAGGAARIAGDMADFKGTSFKEFWGYLKDSLKASLTLGGISVVQVVILAIAFPFYLNLGGIVGLAAMSLIFWISVVWWLSSQYFFPAFQRLDRDMVKVLKKSLILFFDNTGFTIFMGIGSLMIILLSSLTAFLLPGFGAVLLWHQVGLRLRLYKYDYLEENPDADRKRIPWAALLMEDREKVGPRSLRGMIFPWKE